MPSAAAKITVHPRNDRNDALLRPPARPQRLFAGRFDDPPARQARIRRSGQGRQPAEPDQPCGRVQSAGARADRPVQPVRAGQVLPRGRSERDQADCRRGRVSAESARRAPAASSDPALPGPRRLSESRQARLALLSRRAPGRLRARPAGMVRRMQRRPDRAGRPPERRRPNAARGQVRRGARGDARMAELVRRPLVFRADPHRPHR